MILANLYSSRFECIVEKNLGNEKWESDASFRADHVQGEELEGQDQI